MHQGLRTQTLYTYYKMLSSKRASWTPESQTEDGDKLDRNIRFGDENVISWLFGVEIEAIELGPTVRLVIFYILTLFKHWLG